MPYNRETDFKYLFKDFKKYQQMKSVGFRNICLSCKLQE